MSNKKKVVLIKQIKRKDLVLSYNTEISNELREEWLKERSKHLNRSQSDQIIYKIGILVQFLKENKKNIRLSKNSRSRRKLEIKQDVIKRFLEEYTIYAENQEILQNEQTEFNYYPEINDENFSYKIAKKKEFWKNKIPLIDLQYLDGNNHSVKLFPHQKFVKNFISENTPYNGLLLWHGVGVGKSCAAISIAENFREFMYYNDKKILVLTPSNTLIDNWRDEIFNLDKELNKKDLVNVQCTGSKYLNEFKDFYQKDVNQKMRLIKATINKYYEFMGYQKLYNSIDRDLKNQNKFKKTGIREIDRINYIKNRFSNRVIIMDEVHVTREGGSNKDDKKIRPYLEMIARYSENTKLILLSATPMYNISKEIIWLLNLLLWNDKLAPLEEHEIFQKDGIKLMEHDDDELSWNDTDSKYPPINWKKIDDGKVKYVNLITGEERDTTPPKIKGNMAISILSRKSRGYISYLRGEDPFRFPFKLYPNNNTFVPKPKLEIKAGKWIKLDSKKNIPDNTLTFYQNMLSGWQYNNLIQYLEIKDNDERSFSAFKFNQNAMQGSNIIFPSTTRTSDGEFIGKIGDSGWNSCFNKKIIGKKDGSSEVKYEYANHVKNIEGSENSFLHIDHIGKYSKKFESIINSIKSCKGIVFIFSQYINHGIKSLALALEENGLNRINSNGENNNFLINSNEKNKKFCAHHMKHFDELTPEEKINFKQANYIYLDGTVDKKELTKLVRIQRHEDNKNGDNIKVILGSSVIEQGISFYCIREVHVLDPWHHLNKLEQAVGRAFRSKSHFNLIKKKRNITLYIHVSSFNSEDGKESVDERIYRNAYFKKEHMSMIERQLKVNAVDCLLNLSGNIFISDNYNYLGSNNPLANIEMEDSKGKNIIVDLGDQNGSIKCDFDKCNYNCYTKMPIDEIMNSNINDDTFSEEFARDEIDLAKEYIKVLYLGESAYFLKDIIEKIKEIENNIDTKFIYYALHEIVSNKELVYDLYHRSGFILARNGFYIFQPDSLNDVNLPYWYRIKAPKLSNFSVSLKDNFKELETKDNINKSRVTISKFKKKSKKKTADVSKIITKINETDSYIKRTYSEYNNLIIPGNKKTDSFQPSINDLILAQKISCIERLDYNSKKELISDCLLRVISHEQGNKSTKLTPLDNIIMRYYDFHKPTISKKDTYFSHSVLRNKRDLFERLNKVSDSSIDNLPRYFRLVRNDGNQDYYQYSEENNNFVLQSDISDDDIGKLNIQASNISGDIQIYGWIGNNKDNVKHFFIVNNTGYKEKLNEDGSIQEKSKRRGGICGHAKDCIKRPEIAKTINNVLGFNKYNIKPGVKLPAKKSSGINVKRSLCEELELLLRCKQMNISHPTSSKYFYTYDEMLVNKN